MKESPVINIQKRERLSKGERKRMRKEGLLPANINAKGGISVSITIRQDELLKALKENGMSAVYRLQIQGAEGWDAMLREIETAPLTQNWLHVNFQSVALDEKTKAEIAIKVLGKDVVIHKGLEVLQQLDTISVLGLPGDIPNAVEVDVSNMEAGHKIMVQDLTLPEGIEIETEGDREVVSVSHPKGQAEEPETEETTVEEPAADSANAVSAE